VILRKFAFINIDQPESLNNCTGIFSFLNHSQQNIESDKIHIWSSVVTFFGCL
jgi:hypothetical protein